MRGPETEFRALAVAAALALGAAPALWPIRARFCRGPGRAAVRPAVPARPRRRRPTIRAPTPAWARRACPGAGGTMPPMTTGPGMGRVPPVPGAAPVGPASPPACRRSRARRRSPASRSSRSAPGAAVTAARISAMARVISCESSCDWPASSLAAVSTLPAALPALLTASRTPPTLSLTSRAPRAASWTLRLISPVAAPCSATAAEIAVTISLTSRMVVAMPLMALTASLVACWICTTWPPISSVALAV